jgi:hypothetical protein
MATLSPEVLQAIHDAVEAEEQSHASSRALLQLNESPGEGAAAGLDIFFLLMCGNMVRAWLGAACV